MVLHTNVGRGGGALHTFKYILSQNLVDVQHSARYSIRFILGRVFRQKQGLVLEKGRAL